MIKHNQYTIGFLFVLLAFITGCEKKEYSLGNLTTPAALILTTVVAGADVANPNGNGTGTVNITASATNTITYKIDFGNGDSLIVPSGTISYKYRTPGTFRYNITVNAIGTGGITSTISKTITVFVAFEIPADMLASLTGGSSKTWVTDNGAMGHFGVGQPDLFFPNYYAAPPNTREACAYDDEITLSKDANNGISMQVNNKGESFSIGGATAFYGFGGGDGCYPINTGGLKKLIFMDASSTSTPATSTRIQFVVPGNGIINFGTGATEYEILSFTNTELHLRSVGVTGLAWYMKLKVKP